MTRFNVGDVAVLTYTLVDADNDAFQPATDGRVVARVYLPDGTIDFNKTWMADDSGDAEVVNDGPGLFHFDYTITAAGSHRFEFQAYQGEEEPANSLEREVGHFIGRA